MKNRLSALLVFITHIVLCFAFYTGCLSAGEKQTPEETALSNTPPCLKPVQTTSGPLQGSLDEEAETCSWKGVPYAAPPTGDLRWRAPQPVSPWSELRAASQWAPPCIQGKMMNRAFSNPKEISEDCLYLNIWCPRKPGKYPVMVWIHGGIYMYGSGASPMFWGDRLSANGEVVVVTINYRLGPFGFLAHEALAQEDPHGSTGNYGLLDQVASLQWVQKNIEAFGGDRNNVTIFGQSAGSWSVCALLASPLAKGLFHRAIFSSGGGETIWSKEKGYETGRWATKKLGCPKNDLACMRGRRAKDVFDRINVSMTDFVLNDGLYYINHEDEYALPDMPLTMIRSGNFNNVPVLAGSTRDELQALASFQPLKKCTGSRTYKKRLRKNFGNYADRLEQLYPIENYDHAGRAYIAIISDRLMICPTYESMRAIAEQQAATYYYRFDYDDTRVKGFMGAGHVIDIPFYFQTLDRKPTSWLFIKMDSKKPMQLSRAIQSYWTNFAYSGNPNGQGLPSWPAYHADNPQLQVLGEKIYAEGPRLPARAAFWAEYHKNHPPPFSPGELKMK